MKRNEIMRAILDGTPIYYNDKPVEVDEIYQTSIWVKDVGQVDNQDLSINKPKKVIPIKGTSYEVVWIGSEVGIEHNALGKVNNPQAFLDGTNTVNLYDVRSCMYGMAATIKELSK